MVAKTFLTEQFERLEKKSRRPFGHYIRLWKSNGEWQASADQHGGLVGMKFATPEEAIKHVVDCACKVRSETAE